MSEIDKELSERYRTVAREEPPAHVDAAILAAARRSVGAQTRPVGAPRPLRRWYLPVSIAAVITLSLFVTLHVERERPDIALQDAVPVVREKEQKSAQPVPAPAPQPAAPVLVPEPKPARGAAPEQMRRNDSPRSADAVQGAAAGAESASGNIAGSAAGARMRSEAREMSAPAAKPAQSAVLAKRELAPEQWLERIAELRTLQRDQEADEQFAEFKRRYPDYKIPDAMTERIAPHK